MRIRSLYLPIGFLSLAVVTLLVSGCGIYLHDEGLSNIAVEAREKAGALDLPSVIGTARDNRTALANKQVAILKGNAELQANIRLARAVTDDGPMALTVWDSDDFMDDLDTLGVKHNVTLNALDGVYSDTAKWEFQLRSRARRVEVFLGIMPTPCLPDFNIPPAEQFADAVAVDERDAFRVIYGDYVTTCSRIKSQLDAILRPMIYQLGKDGRPETNEDGKPIVDEMGQPVPRENPGLIAEAWNDWKEAEEDLETKRAVARDQLVALKAAERKLSKASAAGPDRASEITSAAEELRNAVEAFNVICETGATIVNLTPDEAKEKDGRPFSNSIICGAKRKALGQLIEAAATGQDPTAADAPKSLKNAAIIAAALPGLVGDVGAFLEAGRKVPLASLRLLEAQASIDKEFADRKVQRQEERVQQAKLAWRATMAEAHHLWQTRYALCKATNAVAADVDRKSQSINCSSMTVATSIPPIGDPSSRSFDACKYRLNEWKQMPIAGTDEVVPQFVQSEEVLTAPDCLLGTTISDAMSDTTVANHIKNALSHYYLAAQSARAGKTEADYRMTLIDGEEALDADERALRLWAELIVVPVNSLASHYEGGLKPEAIADTIVTGAGLGAIAVGVN